MGVNVQYSNLSGSINILKSLVGLGILTLPYATKQVGWIPSLIGMALIAYMTVMGILFAVMAKRCVQAPECEAIFESPEPEDTGLGSFDQTVWRAFGQPGQILCAVCIAVSQIVTGIAYVIIIAGTLQPNKDDHRYLIALIEIGAVLTALSMVRTLKGVSVLSILGLSVYLFIFGALAIQVRHAEDPSSVHAIVWTNPGYGKFFGLTSFAFGAFVISILVADEIDDEKRFIHVCSFSFIACWFFYSIFAMLGYFGYGSETSSMIYKSFPKNSVQYSGSAISLCIILALTFVLQMLPVYNWAEKIVALWKIHYTIARACVIFLTIVVVYLMPSAEFVISYVGGVAAVITGFILPPLVYLRVGTDIKIHEVVQAWGVVIFGLVGAVFIFWIP